jgi:hypothetical protein
LKFKNKKKAFKPHYLIPEETTKMLKAYLYFYKIHEGNQAYWFILIIPDTWEMKFRMIAMNQDKKLVRPNLNQQTGHGHKRLGSQLVEA